MAALQLSSRLYNIVDNAIITTCTLTAYRVRVTTCLTNQEVLGNLTAVSEMSGFLLKVREVSGKDPVREKWPKTVYC